MRKALLLYNPLSGRRRERRVADVEAARAVVRDAGIEVSAAPTRGAADAADQAGHAIADGCDTVLACGGDGTVHDVLQGMVGSDAALGIIPLGTANALAHDLQLPFKPAAAARALLAAKARRIAVGRVEYQDFSGHPGSRYFIVAAGAGVDADLFYKLNPLAKGNLGMAAYYFKAWHLWFTHPLLRFPVELENGTARRECAVSQLLAVRIRNFGGILRELAPGASLANDDLRLVLCHTRSRVKYLRYVFRGLLGTEWSDPAIELASAKEVTCRPIATGRISRIFVEADGELLGTLPARISIQPQALNLLAP